MNLSGMMLPIGNAVQNGILLVFQVLIWISIKIKLVKTPTQIMYFILDLITIKKI